MYRAPSVHPTPHSSSRAWLPRVRYLPSRGSWLHEIMHDGSSYSAIVYGDISESPFGRLPHRGHWIADLGERPQRVAQNVELELRSPGYSRGRGSIRLWYGMKARIRRAIGVRCQLTPPRYVDHGHSSNHRSWKMGACTATIVSMPNESILIHVRCTFAGSAAGSKRYEGHTSRTS